MQKSHKKTKKIVVPKSIAKAHGKIEKSQAKILSLQSVYINVI